MKRYDLYRLVCEQSIPGGNPGGGQGGGGQGGGKRKPGDLRLLANLPPIKPTRPEISQDERRPVNPQDIFGELFENHQKYLDLNQIFYDQLAALLESLENLTPEQLEDTLEDFEQILRNGNHFDPEGQMNLLRNLVSLQNIDANGTGSLGEGFDSWFNVRSGMVLLLIGNLIPNTNGLTAFTGAVMQEIGLEMLFQTGLINLLDQVAGQPVEQQKSIIEQYLTDTLGFAQDSPETRAYIVDYVQAYFEHIRQNGEDAPFIYENVPAEGILSQVLQLFIASQNASTLNQPLFVFLQAVRNGAFSNYGSIYDASTFRRGGQNWTRIRSDIKFTDSVRRLFSVIFRRGGTAFTWRALGGALAATAGSFATGFLQILLIELLLTPMAGYAGFYLGELGKKGAEHFMNNPALIEYFVRTGLLIPETDPITGETVTVWKWNEQLFNTIVYSVAQMKAVEASGGQLSGPEYEQELQRIYTEYLGIFNNLLDSIYQFGGEIGDFLSDLWNTLTSGDSEPVNPYDIRDFQVGS
jgi:AcrR family transcriptional regulator